MKQIKRIDPVSVGKIFGLIYGAIGLAFSLIGALFGFFSSQSGGSAAGFMLVVFMPVVLCVVYALAGFVGGAVSAWLYNMAVRWVGGIKIETEAVAADGAASPEALP